MIIALNSSSRIKLLINIFILAGICSCASVKEYKAPTGPSNFNLIFNVEEALFRYKTARVFIFEELPNCKRKRLGAISLKANENTSTTIKTNSEYFVLLQKVDEKSIPFVYGRTDVSDFSIRIRVQPDIQYKLIHEERSGSQRIVMQNYLNKQWVTLDGLPARNCEIFDIED